MKNFVRNNKYSLIVKGFVCGAALILLTNISNAQTLSNIEIRIDSTSRTFESILKYIESNSKFSFVYHREDLPLDSVVTSGIQASSLYDLLSNLGRKYSIYFERINNQIVVKKNDGNNYQYVIDNPEKYSLGLLRGKIHGVVADSTNRESLPNVNVFLSGTFIGTSTNVNGEYQINNIPVGNYILVVTMIGYKAKTIPIVIRDSNELRINIILSPKTYNLQQVNVTGEHPVKWKRQLEFFKKYFLGNNEFAVNCDIKNETILNFSENNTLFIASADEPLQIVNNAFGYKLECVLGKFTFDKKRQISSFEVYPQFHEIIPATQDSLEDYVSNREDAYRGSVANFLQVISNPEKDFSKEGFKLYYLEDRSFIGQIYTADEIVEHYPKLGFCYLTSNNGSMSRFGEESSGIKIYYNKDGYQRVSTIYFHDETGAEFDPAGYFTSLHQFYIYGYWAKEGVATMLPRFWEPKD